MGDCTEHLILWTKAESWEHLELDRTISAANEGFPTLVFSNSMAKFNQGVYYTIAATGLQARVLSYKCSLPLRRPLVVSQHDPVVVISAPLEPWALPSLGLWYHSKLCIFPNSLYLDTRYVFWDEQEMGFLEEKKSNIDPNITYLSKTETTWLVTWSANWKGSCKIFNSWKRKATFWGEEAQCIWILLGVFKIF